MTRMRDGKVVALGHGQVELTENLKTISDIRTDSLINGGEEWESNISSRSEVPVRTVSQKISHPK